MVTVPGTEGYMGVMAGHAPLVSTLRVGMIDMLVDGVDQRFFIRGGFAEISPSKITVLAEEAAPRPWKTSSWCGRLSETNPLVRLVWRPA